MNSRSVLSSKLLTTAAVVLAALLDAGPTNGQSGVTYVFVAANGIAYSAATQMIYVANSNGVTGLTPVNPITGAVGSMVAISNLTGQVCASDGGNYIFAGLNAATNHICQFDVNAQTVVNAWTLGGNYVDDMAAVLGSPAAVAVSEKILNRSPRFGGVAIFDNGVERSNVYNPFLGSNVIEASRTNRIYGYDNESSPAGTQILQFNSSGISQIGGWGTLQGFGVQIYWRAGWLFASTGQIFDPDRGIQTGSFTNAPISDDAASGRYYIVYFANLTAYDQNTLLPVGTTSVPNVYTPVGPMIHCGTNGFAVLFGSGEIVLIHTPLLSSGASADLSLSLTPPALPVPTGNKLTYTLTISNQGPATAQNVVLTQTLPANASFVSVTSSTGTNSLTGGGLVSSPMIIPAGGTVSVNVNLQTINAGMLASVASITSDSLDPNLSNNVVRLQLPVGGALGRDSVSQLALQTTDIAWEPISGRIFASIPNANWLLGNNIAALDPTTGHFDPLIATPLEDPGKLAVSDNGEYLYAAINSTNGIQRVNIPSRTLDISFPTGFGGVSDMFVLPGTPGTVAATVQTTVALYQDGVLLPSTVAPGEYNFPYYLAGTQTNTVAYEGMTDGLHTIAMGPTGATNAVNLGLINTFDDQIKFAAGRLYTAGGRVIDPVAQTVITNLPYSGLVCPDSAGGKIFYLTTSGSTGTLHSIDITNFVQTGTVTISNISGSPSSLIRWGTDGLAFRTSGSQLFLIRTTFANDANNDGMEDAWELANFGTVNVNPNADPDGDGMSNLEEYLAGTNPNMANSALKLTGVRSQAGNILLNWQGGTNVTYYIQRSASLGANAVWQNVATNWASGLTIGSFTDSTASNTANYYRISVPGE
jgi:uncharacterized repeat protein (TIGR01451 family)